MYQIYWQVWWEKQNVTIIRGNPPVGTSNLCRNYLPIKLLIFWSESKWLQKQILLFFFVFCFFCPYSKIPTKLSTWLKKMTIPPNSHELENRHSLPLSFLQSPSLKGQRCDIRAYPPKKSCFHGSHY